MKKIIKIKTKDKNYKVIIEKNSILKAINSELALNQKIYIIIDKKISFLIKNLKNNKMINVIKINGGEKIKTFKNYNEICLQLLKLKIDRKSSVIAIGGGTVGDLSGFIASTLLRGLKFILIPTTLLSQVDASIGGKNGINTIYGKNLVGTFLQPDKVIIDYSVLKTLPKREIRSGYAEILKHALIKDNKFYNWLDKNYNNVINLKSSYIKKAIIDSIKIKSFFVEKDERESLINQNSRAMLNFGHTFGHALEAMNNFNTKLTHGEAISIGMAIAIKISTRKKFIKPKEYDSFIKHLQKVKLPHYDKRIESNQIYDLLLSDKKNADDKINLILLKKIGKSYFERGLKKEEVKKLIN